MSRGQAVLIAFTLLAGSLLPVQAALNSRLGRELGSPALGALVSFVVGAVGLLFYVLLSRPALPSSDLLRAVPPFLWLGGLCGAVYVTTVILVAPRLGVATLTGLAVAGQMAVSAALDHWGLLGLPVNPVTPSRAAGIVLIVLGVVLLQRK
ncbi:MAG: DMT family transporter [Cytophagales bacterium]|nr:DMT family transporter [Armatimonadota bacterium]